MPAPRKPGVPWHIIRKRYEAGEGPFAISRLLAAEEGVKISRQAIEKRADKENWRQVARIPSRPSPAPEKRQEAKPAPKVASEPPAEPRKAALAKIPEGGPMVALTDDLEAAALSYALEGLSENVTAKRLGVTKETLLGWKEHNPTFATKMEQAAAEFVAARVGNIVTAAESGDWRASQAVLQAHELSKSEFGEKGGAGNGGITLNFNITRGAPVDEAEIIEVEAEEVGLITTTH